MLTLVWTFNLSAITLAHRGDLLKRVVLSSWELLALLAVAQLGWSIWIIYVGAPTLVGVAALWLGLNLLITISMVKKQAHDLTGGQIVLVCSWWVALLAMLLAALHNGSAPRWE
jgi:hypothetical protein